MEWFTYIIFSSTGDRYYIGSTNDLEWRLERHNLGWGRYTKKGIPWKLVYYESYQTKTESLKRENELKRMKSRKYIEELIHTGGRPD